MTKRYFALSRETSIPNYLVFDDEEGVVYLDRTNIQYSDIDFTLVDGKNIVLGSTVGTMLGTSTAQKLGFYGATPTVQGTAIADATGGATIDSQARTALNALLARMRSLGLIAT